MELIVHREVRYVDFVRQYKVYADGVYLGSLKNGDTKLFFVDDDAKTIEIKQALSFFKSQKFSIKEHKANSIHLNVAISPLGMMSNILLFCLLGFFFLLDLFSWSFGGMLIQVLPVYLIGLAAIFVVSAHRYISIKLTDNAIFQ